MEKTLPLLGHELDAPECSLYRKTLYESVLEIKSNPDTVFLHPAPFRARHIAQVLRQRLAIHDRHGDSELFALACELEFWLEVTF